MQNLLAAAPIRPDFHFCDPSFSTYGHPLRLADCLQAEAMMPRGAQLLRYHQPDQEDLNDHDLQFPLKYLHGTRSIYLRTNITPTRVLRCWSETCQIAVEVIDPYVDRPNADAWYDLAPNKFREMAGWVIRQCVDGARPIGGFVTRNISDAVNYLSLPTATLEPPYVEWRKSLP